MKIGTNITRQVTTYYSLINLVVISRNWLYPEANKHSRKIEQVKQYDFFIKKSKSRKMEMKIKKLYNIGKTAKGFITARLAKYLEEDGSEHIKFVGYRTDDVQDTFCKAIELLKKFRGMDFRPYRRKLFALFFTLVNVINSANEKNSFSYYYNIMTGRFIAKIVGVQCDENRKYATEVVNIKSELEEMLKEQQILCVDDAYAKNESGSGISGDQYRKHVAFELYIILDIIDAIDSLVNKYASSIS